MHELIGSQSLSVGMFYNKIQQMFIQFIQHMRYYASL